MIEKSRRELRDYTIIEYQFPTTYTIIIKNAICRNELEISKELYNFYIAEHRKEQRQDRQDRRHKEKNEIFDYRLYERMAEKTKSIDIEIEEKIDREKLKIAINMLNKKEKRRIIYRYYNKLKLTEIAKLENCSHQAIKCSLCLAEQKILEILKKLKF